MIITDNAKTFKATAKLIEKMCKSREVWAYLEGSQISWKFNLERAPWWGGFYERLIGTMKRCLRKVLRNAKLNGDELLTILTELEAMLNSRPLTCEYDEVGEEMLTLFSFTVVGCWVCPRKWETMNRKVQQDFSNVSDTLVSWGSISGTDGDKSV